MDKDQNESQQQAERLKAARRTALEAERAEALADAAFCEMEAERFEDILSGPHDVSLEAETKIGLRNFRAMAKKKRTRVTEIDGELQKLE